MTRDGRPANTIGVGVYSIRVLIFKPDLNLLPATLDTICIMLKPEYGSRAAESQMSIGERAPIRRRPRSKQGITYARRYSTER